MSSGNISFPCIRGVQATMEYYVCMVPLSILSRLFIFSDDELPPQMRSQRIINKGRIPEMKEYILKNRDSYVFSAITASVDGEVFFTPVSGNKNYQQMGELAIPLETKILINDGQHRKAAIEAALSVCPELRYEDIAVVIYPDAGLKRSQQMFSDLNRYAVRPTKSLNILYDQRDPLSQMVCNMVDRLPMFGDLVDREHGSLSSRSKALFTLSGIYSSSEILFRNIEDKKRNIQTLEGFWINCFENIPDWQLVVRKEIRASQLRAEKISGHAVLQKALGFVGNTLLSEERSFSLLQILQEIDWSKDNQAWRGSVVVNDNISGVDKSSQFIAEYIRQKIQGKEAKTA